MKNIQMIKNILIATVFGIAIYGGNQAYEAVSFDTAESILLSNVESLTNSEGGGGGEGRPPEWWDYFDNYIVKREIAINTETCKNGMIYYNGMFITVESCTKYSMAIINECYDGGDRAECVSTTVTYI